MSQVVEDILYNLKHFINFLFLKWLCFFQHSLSMLFLRIMETLVSICIERKMNFLRSKG